MKSIVKTNFKFPNQTSIYKGKVRDVYKHSNIRISAQEYLIPFYTSLNFESIGEVYLEDDIPHIEMMHKD